MSDDTGNPGADFDDVLDPLRRTVRESPLDQNLRLPVRRLLIQLKIAYLVQIR